MARLDSEDHIEQSVSRKDGVSNALFQALRGAQVQKGIIQLENADALPEGVAAELYAEVGKKGGGTGRVEAHLARHGLRNVGRR